MYIQNEFDTRIVFIISLNNYKMNFLYPSYVKVGIGMGNRIVGLAEVPR